LVTLGIILLAEMGSRRRFSPTDSTLTIRYSLYSCILVGENVRFRLTEEFASTVPLFGSIKKSLSGALSPISNRNSIGIEEVFINSNFFEIENPKDDCGKSSFSTLNLNVGPITDPSKDTQSGLFPPFC
jgi:hypothetical protein